MTTKLVFVAGVAMAVVLSIGCSDEYAEISAVPDKELVTVVGTVERIKDDVPVDGGAVVDVVAAGGKEERLFLRSFFRGEPVSEQEQAVYQVILELKIGDRVEGRGERMDTGVELNELTILTAP